MPRKPKGLTRPITRKQARSYDRTRPNPGGRPRLGVTHLAEINGPGAYEARYRATRELLANAEAEHVYTAKQHAAMKKMSPARRAAFKRMLDRAPSIGEARANRGRRRKKRRRATPNRRGFVSVPVQIGEPKKKRKSTAGRKKKAAPRKAGRKKATRKRKLTKAERRAIALRNLRKAHKKRGTRMKRGHQGRSYAKGRYKALRARIGPRSRWTYKSVSKKGRIRDIPDYALLGYPSAAAMRRVTKSGTEKQRAALSRKLQRLYERRERDAEKTAARIRAGRGVFTPNAEDVLSYEEWEEMRPNARKRKKTTKRRKKKLTKAQRAAISRRNLKKARAARRKGTAKRKTSSKRRRRGGRKLTKAQRRRIALRNLAKARAARRGGKKTARKGRRRRKARKLTGKKLVVYVSNRRRRGRRRRRSYASNQGAYAVNRRRKRGRRRYRRNQGFMAELTSALKLGALVTAGFASHRALTHVIDNYGLSKIEALNTGAIAPYRGILSGLLGAGIGIGITMMLPLQAAKAPVAAGMAASFIHGALLTALNAAGAAQAAAYLSNYPNAEGSVYGHGIGSYFTFRPHQVYSGYGSYYEIPQPMSGFGQPMLTQAAAGYGAAPMLTQAAAGYGQPMLTQAAAGYGQPMVTQAAAGTGEYVAYGVQGVGEYDEMPVSGVGMMTDEGVYPNLHSAEQALSVAEAAAGVGSPEIPLQSTVDPVMIADPIADIPGGSRAGVFQGGDGIFG